MSVVSRRAERDTGGSSGSGEGVAQAKAAEAKVAEEALLLVKAPSHVKCATSALVKAMARVNR